MEIFTVSLISLALCFLSYVCYKLFGTNSDAHTDETNGDTTRAQLKKTDLRIKNKKFIKKAKPKMNQSKKRKTSIADTVQDSDTESYSLEQQLTQTIMNQQLTHDVINTTEVNAKPSIAKKATSDKTSSLKQTSSKTKSGLLTKESVYVRDADWENVVSRKHKKKLYPVSQIGEEDKYSFTLDEEGGLVEIPMCEIFFPAESVMQPLGVTMEFEKYKKFVDDTEERVYLTPAVYFTIHTDETKLRRQFTMKLNTKRMMGRGWDGNVCCQIETKDVDDSWTASGRTEYLFGKPVQIVSDELKCFRAVLTRGHNGAISRDLNIAAYIAKPRSQNPEFHVIHLCVYDKSEQSKYKMEMNMQNFLIKMPPRECSVTFGSDLQFRIKSTQKYSPDESDVFIRWAEVCKAFVNVKFQIRLTKNETDDPNFESEIRTLVFLEVLKVSPSITITQEEYFHFYWISATFYPQRKKKLAINEKDNEKISEDDGFASGSDFINTLSRIKAPSYGATNKSAPFSFENSENYSKEKRKRKKKISQAQSSNNATNTSSDVKKVQNHIDDKYVQSTKTQGTNQKSSQVKQDKNATNQNSSTSFERRQQKSGKSQYSNSNNQVQSNKPPQGNPQNNKNQTSNTADDRSSSQGDTSKFFRRIFRSPGKKSAKPDSISETTKTLSENNEVKNSSRDTGEKDMGAKKGGKPATLNPKKNQKKPTSTEKSESRAQTGLDGKISAAKSAPESIAPKIAPKDAVTAKNPEGRSKQRQRPRKTSQNRNDLHERPQPLNPDTHERPQSVNISSNKEKQFEVKDKFERTTKKLVNKKPSSSIATSHDYSSTSMKTDDNRTTVASNKLQNVIQPVNKSSKRPQDKTGDSSLESGGQHSSEISNKKPRNPRIRRPNSTKQENGVKSQHDDLQSQQKIIKPQKLESGPKTLQNGPRNQQNTQKSQQNGSRKSTNSNSALNIENHHPATNGVVNPNEKMFVDQPPKERRQRKPRNRTKGPTEQGNKIDQATE